MIAAWRVSGHANNARQRDRMTQTSRVLLGFALAPLSPCILLTLLTSFYGADDIGFWLMLILPISYMVSFCIGGPIYLLLKNFKKTKFIHFTIAGVAASMAPIFYIFFYIPLISGGWSAVRNDILPVHYYIMALMMGVGVVISITFWLIVRPDHCDPRDTNASGA
jgi:hypothetical protein